MLSKGSKSKWTSSLDHHLPSKAVNASLCKKGRDTSSYLQMSKHQRVQIYYLFCLNKVSDISFIVYSSCIKSCPCFFWGSPRDQNIPNFLIIGKNGDILFNIALNYSIAVLHENLRFCFLLNSVHIGKVEIPNKLVIILATIKSRWFDLIVDIRQR